MQTTIHKYHKNVYTMGKDKRKPLVELESENGKIKRFWESGKDAAAFYDMSAVVITVHVKGRSRHAKKKYFRYATPEEVAAYRAVNQVIADQDNQEPTTHAVPVDIPQLPIEVIPEKVDKRENQEAELSPFDVLIKKGKEKFI